MEVANDRVRRQLKKVLDRGNNREKAEQVRRNLRLWRSEMNESGLYTVYIEKRIVGQVIMYLETIKKMRCEGQEKC